MDSPSNDSKEQPTNQPKQPGSNAGDPVGPPPNPRETSIPSMPANQEFNPSLVNIESHEDAFSDGDSSLSPITEAGVNKPEPEMHINRPPSWFKRFITSKKLWLTLLVLLVALIGAWFVQPSRVWIVNTIGLRVPVTVVTKTAAAVGKPSAVLQKTTVKLNSLQASSDDSGQAKFSAPYGQANISAQKAGYKDAAASEFYDFDPFFGLLGGKSNNQTQVDLQLVSVGIPIKFKAVSWLTSKPIIDGSFKVGDVVAKSDDQGMISLDVAPTDAKTITVEATAAGYTDKQVQLKIQADPIQQITLVPAGKDYFISKSSGQLGVYSSDLDGNNVQQVVAPSASETADIDFSVSPSGKYAVLASTREAKHNASNKLVQKLYVVNLASGSLSSVDEGLWFDFADWSGDTLTYTTTADSATQRLASIDASSGKKTDLSTAASYGQVRVSLNSAIYTLNHAAGSADAGNDPTLNIVPLAGGTEKNIGNKVSAVTQTDYDRIVYQGSDNAWHEYNVNTSASSNVSAPASANRVFLGANSADGQNRLFVDKVDGITTLFVKSVANGKEQKLYGAAGLTKPVRWSGNLVVFRVSDSTQTADYVTSLDSGQTAKKIGDATASTSPQSNTYFSFN